MSGCGRVGTAAGKPSRVHGNYCQICGGTQADRCTLHGGQASGGRQAATPRSGQANSADLAGPTSPGLTQPFQLHYLPGRFPLSQGFRNLDSMITAERNPQAHPAPASESAEDRPCHTRASARCSAAELCASPLPSPARPRLDADSTPSPQRAARVLQLHPGLTCTAHAHAPHPSQRCCILSDRRMSPQETATLHLRCRGPPPSPQGLSAALRCEMRSATYRCPSQVLVSPSYAALRQLTPIISMSCTGAPLCTRPSASLTSALWASNSSS